MPIQLGSAYGKVTLDSSGVSSGVATAKKSMVELHQAGLILGNGLMNIGDGMKAMGQQMTLMFTLPIAALGAKSFQVMKDFDKSLNVLKAVAGATNDEMERMTKLARQLGADLTLPGTSAADAAAAMAELAKAGLSVNDIMSAARGVLQLSAAGQIDNARAAEITANALNAFKLKGEDAVMIADLLAASANASSAEVSEMADSLQMAAAVAAMSGMSIQETIASLSLLANAGIQGSDAGTSLKQMLLQLQTPTNKARDLMRDLGINVYDSAGNMKSMREIIQIFSTQLGGLTQQERNFALGIIFGSDAIRAANIVLMQGTNQYDQMTTSITKAGAAADLAGALMEGLPGVVENIKSAFETAAIAAIEPFKDDIIALGNAFAKLLNTFSNLPEPMRKFIVVMLILLALTGPLLIFIGTLVTMAATVINAISVLSGLGITVAGVGTTITGTLIPAITAMGAALSLALVPLLVILIGLTFQIGILYLAWKYNFLGMRDAVASAVKFWKSIWAAFLAFLRGDTDAAFAHLREALDTFKEHFSKVFSGFETFAANWRNFLEAVRNGISITVNYISKAFTNINWSNIGKFILMGIANGMFMGIPSLLLMAKKVAESLLLQLRKSLDIKSPSGEAMKLGALTAQGYMLGVQNTMNPDAIARSLAKPITNNQSQQQVINLNLPMGVTLQQVRGEIAANGEQLMNTMIGALSQ